jgi:cytochrome P450
MGGVVEAQKAPSRYQSVLQGSGEDAARLVTEHPQEYHTSRLDGIQRLGPGLVAVHRMSDIQALTRSRAARQFEVSRPAGMGLGGRRAAIPLDLDGAEHTKWRKVLDPIFAPRKVAGLEPRVRARAGELIDAFIEDGSADAYERWCEPLPSSIFLSIMGIPPEELDGFLSFKNTILAGGRPTDAQPTFEERMSAFDECEAWFAAEFDRRERSGDFGDDLIGWLMTAEIDDRRITREELHGICNLLMIAGLDTVASSLACILVYLARHPGDRKLLIEEPERWPVAIEELMRYESPVTMGSRHVVEDVELPSGRVQPGTNIIVWWAGANLDAEAFDDPATVKLDRAPNPHIGFASGWHRCLGSHLARMELRAALDVWHQRIPQYRIPDEVELTYSINPRAPHHLPLVWD